MLFNWKKPKLVALFAYRFDYEMVPDLLKNIEGFVDDYISWDDRKSESEWYHEGNVRRHLIESARERGADWALGIDPDERFENGAGKKIRKLIKERQKKIYGFRYRELWEPNKYRIDGIWGEKVRYCLFPLLPNQEFMNLHVHSPWFPQNSDYSMVPTDINLYHLKMIEPENRVKRAEIYNSLDPDRKIQKIGYDYLAEEGGLELEQIQEGREYCPEYKRFILDIRK